MNMRALPIVLTTLACAGCTLPLELAREAPALADMEQPLALAEEPDDESQEKNSTISIPAMLLTFVLWEHSPIAIFVLSAACGI